MTENDHNDNHVAMLSSMAPKRAAEYLIQLQLHIDALTNSGRSMRQRIEKLEADRDLLRSRLEEARRQRPLKLRSSPKTPRPANPDSASVSEPSLEPLANHALSVRVAGIVDEFSLRTLKPEWLMLNLNRSMWKEELEAHQPDLFFVESAFSGADASWAGEIARFGEWSNDLAEVVAWCRSKDIPTVFWNKEDPINFEMFISSACQFDYVFTVDAESANRYAPHFQGKVGLLPFAAQPQIHYPPSSFEDRQNGVAFAGAYYASKHEERKRQMEVILDTARGLGLDIFDRTPNNDSRFQWPAKYQSHIRGSLSYAKTLDVYRSYKVSLNVNTVTNSPTMCSRRIFELLSTGSYIVSGPSAALGSYVPEGLVQIASSAEEAHHLIEQGLNDPSVLEKAAERGPAWISQGQTYADRVAHVLDTVL